LGKGSEIKKRKMSFTIVTKYILFSTLILSLTFTACSSSNRKSQKKVIFSADREAPIGWSYLEIYEDSTFEFIDVEYHGTVSIRNDTFFFNYEESIPKAGKKAIIKGNYLLYIEGKYLEKLEIKQNEIK
jgi:hypothetical protein